MRSKKDVGALLHKTYAGFRVWAPLATSVAVTGVLNDWGETPLEAEGDGYWYGKVHGAKAGQEYKYIINGSEHKNDPRAFQVTTDDGNSVLVDASFEWTDDAFEPIPIEKQVLYELHVGTFNRSDPAMVGTFLEAIEKLDYLQSLGVTTIALMPIASMYMDRGWGYAPDYLFAVESLYGGRFGLQSFVKAAHERGLGVVLDVVYNHFNHTDMWHFDGWGEEDKGGIYYYADWRSKTPWGERPDYGRQEVRQFFTDNVHMWLNDCHIDGLRVDSTIYIRNVEGHNDDPANDLPDGWKLLQEVTHISKKVNPNALLIAEDAGCNEFLTKPVDQGGAGFSSQWRVNFPGVIRGVIEPLHDADRDLSSLIEALELYFNGDAFQSVIYSDSHDSASNGSKRLNEEISPGHPTSIFARQRSLLAAGIVLTAPGLPMLLQGQEFLQGGSFSDWQALDWGQAEQFNGIVEAYKHLIALRKNSHQNTSGLSGQGCNVLLHDNEKKLLAYERSAGDKPGDSVVVVINFMNHAQEDYELKLPHDGTWVTRFASDWSGYSTDFKSESCEKTICTDGVARVAIGPYTVIILSQD